MDPFFLIRLFRAIIEATDVINGFFTDKKQESLIVPDGVSGIKSGKYKGYKRLKYIELPATLKLIGKEAFRNCVSLKAIDIPEGLVEIESLAFENCRSLRSVTFPSTLREIGIQAFAACSSLEAVTIPEGVETIGAGAFENCQRLCSVNLPKSLKTLGIGAFEGCPFQQPLTKPAPAISPAVSSFVNIAPATPLTENLNFPKAEALAKEAQDAMNAKNYSLALTKFDAALALCPRIEAWKEKREFAKQLRDMAQERDKEREDSKKKQEELDDANRKLAEKRKQEPIVTPTPPQPTPAPALAPPTSRTAGDRKVLTVDGIEYAFRWCPPGEFMMGSPESEPDRFSGNWEKQHRVRLTQGFWLLETEVTQEMWESVMGENPSWFKGARNPVETVSWNDSQEFCRKLGQKLNREIKLPTEAQWEYACRAGSTGAYAGTGNLDSMGWYKDNSDSKTHEVGLKRPNDWGLYDMHGNVCEWCSDYWDEDYYVESPTSDPENTSSSASPYRVNRGGGWNYDAGYCRSADRSRDEPGHRFINLGLRVLLVPSSRD